MGITTKKYVKKPLYVDAVRITRGNFSEVVKWCKGQVRTEHPNHPQHPGKKYIKIEAHNPINTRQTKAYVGDWILQTERGFKIYSHKNFVESFDEVVDPELLPDPSYPHEEGGFIVIGPECFAQPDGSVLSWKGVNYVPQNAGQNVESETADFDDDFDLDSCAVPGSRPVPSEQEILEEQRSAGLIRGE